MDKIQQEIVERYGVERLNEVRRRLCADCRFASPPSVCDLLPITSDGHDCPYWQPKRRGEP